MSDGSAAEEVESKGTSTSRHDGAKQLSNDNDGVECNGNVKPEPQLAASSQLSLAQIREKIAALEKVHDAAILFSLNISGQ
jgi:hypothetical protein